MFKVLYSGRAKFGDETSLVHVNNTVVPPGNPFEAGCQTCVMWTRVVGGRLLVSLSIMNEAVLYCRIILEGTREQELDLYISEINSLADLLFG